MAAFGGFILPIYVLFFRYHSITLFEVALLAVVFEASVLIFEIPTGLFADLRGRKLSVNIGFALYAVSGAVFIFSGNLTGFIIAEILFGVAEAFISGAGEALAVDSISTEDKTTLLSKMYATRSRLRIIVTAAMMGLAGYLFAVDAAITFFPVLIGGAGGFLLSLLYTELKGKAKNESNRGASRPGKLLQDMFCGIKRSAMLKIVFGISLAANFAFEGSDQYWQVLCSESFDLHIKYFGMITAVSALISFIIVGPIIRKSSNDTGIVFLILTACGAAISSLPFLPIQLLPAVLVIYFVGREITSPVFSLIINRRIDSVGRATFLSGYNMVCSTGEIASGLMIGFMADRLGLPPVFVLCGIVLVISVNIALVLTSIRKTGQG